MMDDDDDDDDDGEPPRCEERWRGCVEEETRIKVSTPDGEEMRR
jgi:hypothetical protein